MFVSAFALVPRWEGLQKMESFLDYTDTINLNPTQSKRSAAAALGRPEQ
jgi:hypothetical protein